jgi:hypothetical protein
MVRSLKLLFASCIATGLLVTCSFSQRFASVTIAGPTATESPFPAAAEDSSEYLQALRDLGYGKYLDVSDAARTKTTQAGWDIYRYNLADCRCLLSTEYVLMARQGAENTKTVFWMEGGGSCFPGHEECTTVANASVLKAQLGLGSSNAANPVRDWNFIYVPYCDGSIHLGDSDADYDGNGEADHWHWGLKNTSAAVRLMKELFPQSQEILVAGCSAGGYGTLGTTPIVRLQFPQANLYVLNQSGLGLMNPNIRATYESAYRIWNLTSLLPQNCPRCADQLIYLYPWKLAQDPRLSIGVFSSYHDATFTANWGMAPADFETLLLETTAAVRAEYPDRFERYFVAGDGHCVRDYAYAVDSISIWEWIGYMVQNDQRWMDILE